MRKYWATILWLISAMLSPCTFAIEIAGMSLYEDKASALNFSEVQQQTFKPASRQDLSFGRVYSTFWLRLELSAIPEEPHYLQSCFIQADILDAYIPENGSWRTVTTGDTRRFSARDIPHECYVFDLQNIDNTVVYFKTYAGVHNRLPIKLVTQEDFWQGEVTRQFGYGFYFAVLVSMIIYNFFLFLITRDNAYFYYVGYLGSIALFLGEMSGHSVRYLWPDEQFWADYTPIIFASLAIAFGSGYIVLITNAERYAPQIREWMRVCILLAVITIVATFFKGFGAVILLLITLLIMLGLSTSAIIAAARAGYRPAYVMIAAIALMIPGALIYFARSLGVIEPNWLTSNVLYITSSLEAMILSVALAYRIQSLNSEIEQRDKQVSDLRQRFSRQQIRTADDERRALARELHDGIGQGLLAVKNLIGQMNDSDQRSQAVKQIRSLISDSRNLARNMHPQQIENLGFATALETMLVETIRPADMELELHLDDLDETLNHDTELQLYRIAQECASNIVRHSQASHVVATLVIDHNKVIMTIIDNGIGIHQGEYSGIGFFSIKERAAIIGAQIEMKPNLPQGTVVSVTLSLK